MNRIKRALLPIALSVAVVGARAAKHQNVYCLADRGLPAPFHRFGPLREEARQRRMIDVLHEQRVGLAGREHPDGFGRHRPLRDDPYPCRGELQ